MKVLTTIPEMRAWLKEGVEGRAVEGTVGGGVGLVPTMGCLHHGHGYLLERARQENDRVVLSVFVNPLQFRREAFEVYPRQLDEDLKLAEARGVDAVFVPSVEEMYGGLGDGLGEGRGLEEILARVFALQDGSSGERDQDGFTVDRVGDEGAMGYIRVPARLAMRMDGRLHPWHFDGVATVVDRLFEIIEPTRAYFGQKDIQQVAILDSMNEWVGGVTKIVRVPVVRDADGVSASSRLVMLSPSQRSIAASIAGLLGQLTDAGEGGVVNELIERFTDGVARIEMGGHALVIDSVVCVDSVSLEDVEVLSASTAVYGAYLIDGIRLAETRWVGELAC